MHDIYSGKVIKPNYFGSMMEPVYIAAVEECGEPPHLKWRPTEVVNATPNGVPDHICPARY
ncbi:hypothetical protein thsrh120_48080 [Rhizobium sp. No.120]